MTFWLAHHELANLGAYALGLSGVTVVAWRAALGPRGQRWLERVTRQRHPPRRVNVARPGSGR